VRDGRFGKAVVEGSGPGGRLRGRRPVTAARGQIG